MGEWACFKFPARSLHKLAPSTDRISENIGTTAYLQHPKKSLTHSTFNITSILPLIANQPSTIFPEKISTKHAKEEGSFHHNNFGSVAQCT